MHKTSKPAMEIGDRMENGEVLSFKQASKRLNVGLSTVYKLANSGELTAFRIGGAWRTSVHACNELIERRIQAEKKRHGWFGAGSEYEKSTN